MILTIQMLYEKYKDYTDPKGKIARDVKDGKLLKVSHGLYEDHKYIDGKLLAGYILSPSYLSFDYALAYYDLIPERVYVYTSASFSKKKIKDYSNCFGRYNYRDVPSKIYPMSIVSYVIDGYSYKIATPEKAICDKLYTISPVKSIKALKSLLFEDLRIDEDDFYNLNKQEILKIAPLYHSTNLNLLTKFLENE